MKTCPYCNSHKVIIFDSDNDLCRKCDRWFPAVKDVEQKQLRINRAWAMPNRNTFSIKPINELVKRLTSDPENVASVDPFSNGKQYATITNDLDPDLPATCHEDAFDFLKGLMTDNISLVLFDPPYSPRQVSECYKKLGKTVNMQTTQSSYWTKLKKEIARIVRPGGKVLTCGWNSGGIGKTLGFEIEEILLVAHGGWHNDTICTVEVKR
jgi:hypothetical protein